LLQNKLSEIKGELQNIFTGNRNLLDSILPPLLFVLINEIIGFEAAMWSAFGLAIIFAIIRLLRGQSLISALGGIGGVLVAIIAAKWSGHNEGFFLPGIISNQFFILAIIVSLLIGKPLIAVGSYFLRRWPLEWYWHQRVRPAYMEVSLLWLVFLSIRSALQVTLYLNHAVDELAILTLITGAPATVTLLAISFLYGSWRLRQLGGPSVVEYQQDSSPPWNGQNRGF
jgi:hypothetical protein